MENKYKYIVNSPEWERQANHLARSVVQISCCFQCGAPIVKGYCCNICGSSNPSGTEEERQQYYEWVWKQQK